MRGWSDADLKKLAGDWPADADDYDVVIECEKGSLTLFDKEAEGTEKPLPLKLKLKDLKAKPVYVHCKAGIRAQKTAALLKAAGVDATALKATYDELEPVFGKAP